MKEAGDEDRELEEQEGKKSRKEGAPNDLKLSLCLLKTTSYMELGHQFRGPPRNF